MEVKEVVQEDGDGDEVQGMSVVVRPCGEVAPFSLVTSSSGLASAMREDIAHGGWSPIQIPGPEMEQASVGLL